MEITPLGSIPRLSRLYTDDQELLSKVIRWKKVEVDATYRYPDGTVGKCIVFPSSIYGRIAKELKHV